MATESSFSEESCIPIASFFNAGPSDETDPVMVKIEHLTKQRSVAYKYIAGSLILYFTIICLSVK